MPSCDPDRIEALYLHIPFCVSRCGYCGFYSQALCGRADRLADYVAGLMRLVRRVGEAGLLEHVRTAYIGGGTPTLAGEALVGLAREVAALCPELVEFTCEANPDSLDASLAQGLAGAGVTRVSLGVQSLNDAELRGLGRAHTAEQALAAAACVKDAGLVLSCDLMCGVPFQDADSWEASLLGVVGAHADHVSCYPLSIEEHTPFDDAILAGAMEYPDADLQADMMLAAARVLGEAGFERYEVASYARDGKACAHNIAYWTGRQYLGLGASASLMLNPANALRLAELLDIRLCGAEVGSLGDSAGQPDLADGGLGLPLGAFLEVSANAARVRLTFAPDSSGFTVAERALQPFLAEGESLDSRQAAAEDLMLGMRMVRGVSADALAGFVTRGIPRERLKCAVDEATRDGLAASAPDGSLRPTQKGWLLGNELFGLMWETAGE